MRRTIVAAWNVPADGIAPALVILSVCLGAGGLTGCLLAARVGGAGETSLHAYLEAFLAAAQGGAVDIPALWGQVWDTLRWPLAALLLGFTALGVLGLPVLTGGAQERYTEFLHWVTEAIVAHFGVTMAEGELIFTACAGLSLALLLLLDGVCYTYLSMELFSVLLKRLRAARR